MAPENYKHHGISGEYVFTPSGDVMPPADAPKPQPTKPHSAPKAKN
jgi:hypothetical protein